MAFKMDIFFHKGNSNHHVDQWGDVEFPSSARDVCPTFIMQTEAETALYCPSIDD
jgi:hypothetical protein